MVHKAECGGRGKEMKRLQLDDEKCMFIVYSRLKENGASHYTAKNGKGQVPCINGMSQLHSSIEGNFPLSFYHEPKEMIGNHIKQL
jgi:hypothetical protein